MDVCPKCGRKLTLLDLKPECPKCGVNLLYYNINERLEVDAINAELEHARTVHRLNRAKAAMVGSVFTIVRIVLLAVVVGMFFLPLAKLSIAAPYVDKAVSINAIGLYEGISAMDFDGLLKMFGSAVLGKSFILYAVSIVTIILAALAALLELILSFLSCSKRGFARNLIFAVSGIVFAVVSIITFSLFISNISGILPGVITGSVGFGVYLVIAAFVLVIAINIIIKIKGVKIEYQEVYVDRVPYSLFVEKFGEEHFDLEKLEAIKDEMEQYKLPVEDEEEVKEEDKEE
ncbi:MAG: hypothetical protein IJT03_01745 [Clostridia bacterium]|nr:hypothetical protein [Clostridia bacterium]